MTPDARLTDQVTSGVMLLSTGGTIATRTDPATGLSRASLGGSDLAELLPGREAVPVRELDRRPSWALTLEDMRDVAQQIREEVAAPDRSGVVVTVGTSALEYAAYLADLFLDAQVPVVFTGAMRKADEPSPDGPANLLDAFAVAASEESRNRGVLVCFAHRVMSARGVYKQQREDEDAFIDVSGDLGTVVDGRVHYVRRPIRRGTFGGRIDSSVEIVKMYPGAPGAILDSVRQRAPRGVVIEGMPGAGGLPPTVMEALHALGQQNVVMVISSRAPYGRVPDPPTGGTGSPLDDLPLLSAGDLTTEKAWVLLSAVLGESEDPLQASAAFSAAVRAPA